MGHFLTLLLLVTPAHASSYTAHLIRVYDGDTIVARVDIWPRITAEVSIRLRGVQAPELGWRAGSACEREASTIRRPAGPRGHVPRPRHR